MLADRASQYLVIDTNVLLMFVVGAVSRDHIEKFKRTRQYTASDYDLLLQFIAPYEVIVVTPNILTEVTNLVGQLEGKLRTRCMRALASLVPQWRERYMASRDVVRSGYFDRLGLTDTAIHELAGESIDILTDDLDLYLAVSSSGRTAINFNHVRAARWNS